jgi:hypothetical protein
VLELPAMAFTTWDYDGFSKRSWDDGNVSVSVEPTGEIYWARFDAQTFAGQVIVQGFEDFERDGVPIDVLVDTPAIRMYLNQSRRPGASTHLLLGAEAPIAWKLDGMPLANPYVPGPEGSNVLTDDRVSWRRSYGPWWARILVAPGAHEVDANGLSIKVLIDPKHQCTVVVENGNLIEPGG